MRLVSVQIILESCAIEDDLMSQFKHRKASTKREGKRTVEVDCLEERWECRSDRTQESPNSLCIPSSPIAERLVQPVYDRKEPPSHTMITGLRFVHNGTSK